jgi:putative PIN family toxin of toxin-antitoxin system
MTQPYRFVLDTNAVIDWLVFEHPYLDSFRDRVRSRDVLVLTNALAVNELARVLGYPMLKLSEARRVDVLARYASLTTQAQMPEGFAAEALSLPPGFPHCRDRDDDAFLALTFHSQATALVTRDNALLKLQKRTRKFGVAIVDITGMMELLGLV